MKHPPSRRPLASTVPGVPPLPAATAHAARSALRIGLLLVIGWAGLHANASSTEATVADPPVVAVHYQDILAAEPPFIDLFVPPPDVAWSEFTYSASDCLRADGVHEGPPEKVLIIRFEVLTEGTCATKVDLLFGDGTSTWAASARVVVNRLAPLPALTQVLPRFSQELVSLPGSRPGDPPGDLMLVGVTNPYPDAITVLGLGNDAGFNELVGRVVTYDPAVLMNRYSDLARRNSPFEATTIAPGAEGHFALLVAAGSRMPSGAGTITIRPVARVQLGEEEYTLEFPRMSTAWGVELP